jgi:hypothetical protein
VHELKELVPLIFDPFHHQLSKRTTFWLAEDKKVRLLPGGLQEVKNGFRLSQEQKSVQIPLALSLDETGEIIEIQCSVIA